MSMTVTDYHIRTHLDAQSGEYVALVSEFPSLSWFASTAKAAVEGMENMLRDVVADMRQNSESVPAPARD